MNMLKVGLICSLALSGPASMSLAAATTYHVTDLGVLPGGNQYSQSSGAAINNAGRVVGTSDKPYGGYNNGTEYGFVYSNGKLANIGKLPGGFSSVATAINNVGQVVGNSGDGSYYGETAFVWTHGKRVALPYLQNGTFILGYGINDSGEVTGYGALYPDDNYYQNYEAFVYANGQLKEIPPLGDGNNYGMAINNAGDVAGFSNVGFNNAVHAFLYSAADGSETDLGILSGGSLSQADALNSSDEVVGTADTANLVNHGFAYIAGKLIDLGSLGGAKGTSGAYGINGGGVIVGQSSIQGANDTFHGFVYTGGKLYDLNSLLDSSGKSDLITDATGINASGEIVGDATINGWTHAVLLTPNH